MALKATTPPDLTEELPSLFSAQNVLLMILVAMAGALLVINLLPVWLPGLALSAASSQPKVFWYLSRGSAVAAYWILWLAMAMGVVITNKMAQIWPGIPPAYEIHQYTSLMGMGFALFHALILMGDQYIHYTFGQVFLPFASVNYRPIWVGIGQLAFYTWAIVNVSFYVRKRIGKYAWRLIHFASYASFLGVMFHGIFSGTDVTTPWMQTIYWLSGAALLVLTIYRILLTRLSHPAHKVNKVNAG